MESINNNIVVVGMLVGNPVFSHRVMDEDFYTSVVQVKRQSGVVDNLPITLPEKLIVNHVNLDTSLLRFDGQVRSYNKIIDGMSRLVVTIFAQDMNLVEDGETLNHVSLTGTLCKPPQYRSTPFGREICDMMIAVNRAFGKSDYIPCIAWGRNAKYASKFIVGDEVTITGRLQSREYFKHIDDGTSIRRETIEVSAFSISSNSDIPIIA